MTYKAVIIDDESKLRKVLEFKIKKFYSNIEIVGEAGNVQDAIEIIDMYNPDIVFLDIAMPGGSGFDLLENYNELDFEIIFVTGFDEYAIDALKLSAIDYILKPVRDEELQKAVDKAINEIDKDEQIKQYNVLKHNLLSSNKQEEKIAIPNNSDYFFVFIKDIVRCEGWQKYSKIFLTDGTNLVSSYNIGVYKELLESYGFISCHKSHLINRMHIKKYSKEGTVDMIDHSQVPVSRRKKDKFLQLLLKND